MKKYKIMTFNVRVQVESDGENAFFKRTERLAQVIKEEKPDIIGFQEVDDCMRETLENICSDYTFYGTGRDGDGKGESVPVAIKKGTFDCLENQTIWLSNTPLVPRSTYGEDQSDCSRIYVKCLLKTSEGKVFTFINTHYDHIGVIARKLESKQILGEINSINGDFIMTGDFNATPDACEMKMIVDNPIKKTYDLTKNLGPTFHCFGKWPMEKRVKIDYIFSNINSDKTYIVEDKNKNGLYYSDHYAICSMIEI